MYFGNTAEEDRYGWWKHHEPVSDCIIAVSHTDGGSGQVTRVGPRAYKFRGSTRDKGHAVTEVLMTDSIASAADVFIPLDGDELLRTPSGERPSMDSLREIADESKACTTGRAKLTMENVKSCRVESGRLSAVPPHFKKLPPVHLSKTMFRRTSFVRTDMGNHHGVTVKTAACGNYNMSCFDFSNFTVEHWGLSISFMGWVLHTMKQYESLNSYPGQECRGVGTEVYCDNGNAVLSGNITHMRNAYRKRACFTAQEGYETKDTKHGKMHEK